VLMIFLREDRMLPPVKVRELSIYQSRVNQWLGSYVRMNIDGRSDGAYYGVNMSRALDGMW
jgi:hypothetical protein